MIRPEPPEFHPGSAALRRDAALTRLSRARRWMLAGAAALTAAFAGLVASVTPKLASARARGLSGLGARAPRQAQALLPPPASAAALGLRAPSTQPASAAPSSDASPSATAASPSGASGSTGNTGSSAASVPTPSAPVAAAPAATSGGS